MFCIVSCCAARRPYNSARVTRCVGFAAEASWALTSRRKWRKLVFGLRSGVDVWTQFAAINCVAIVAK